MPCMQLISPAYFQDVRNSLRRHSGRRKWLCLQSKRSHRRNGTRYRRLCVENWLGREVHLELHQCLQQSCSNPSWTEACQKERLEIQDFHLWNKFFSLLQMILWLCIDQIHPRITLSSRVVGHSKTLHSTKYFNLLFWPWLILILILNAIICIQD